MKVMKMSTRKEFEKLFNNEMPEEEARQFLIDFYKRGESGEDIAVAAQVMRKHSIELPLPKDLREKAIDVVGTGGDRSGSFNISTTVSLLLASMGCVVAKHGNRSITSHSGSADVLEALGINLNLPIDAQIKMLEETGFTFIFAMNHHPAMKHIMPIRKSIDHRTIFNILGPLTNPAGARKYLLGVFDPSFIKRMAEALLELDTERAFVVSSHDGMDEISLSDNSSFAYVENGRISEGEVNPETFGFQKASKEAILGGDAQFNAQITHDIFNMKELGPKRDIVLLNTAYALFADGNTRDIQEAVEKAKAAIESGKAAVHLKKIAKVSQKLTL
ncbi:MAG: anthranilate phosphoribosyltransferase [Sulfurovum sp.]|nr:anthranilate phosphoribosyltransferase [Sulfurovum sp.]MCB4776622.1 anthranilate phosphoribosyltransferase [Sulfurovum sp.]